MEEIKKFLPDLKIEKKENITAIKDEIREDIKEIKKDVDNIKGQWEAERREMRNKIDNIKEKS